MPWVPLKHKIDQYKQTKLREDEFDGKLLCLPWPLILSIYRNLDKSINIVVYRLIYIDFVCDK